MGNTSKSRRRLLGCVLGILLVLAAALALLPARGSVTVATPALVLIVPGLLAGFVGGRTSGGLTAVVAALALDVVFIEPYGTLDIHLIDDLVALVAFTAVAMAVATLVEVANTRRVEKVALEQGEDARRALLRSVSHDLRTPLATIRAITSDLRDGIVYDPRTRDELLGLVGDEAERLDRLVANLLSMSRIEAGALRPDVQAVALDELVHDRVQRLARILRDVCLTTDVASDLPLVDADYTLLDQVLTNLVENAVRHTPPGRAIRIEAHPAGQRVEVSVTDEGPGVAAHEGHGRQWVFEPFNRGGDSRSSGLGLAICKAIVEAHGGSIGVDAAPGGLGARFSFTLPIHRLQMNGLDRMGPVDADGTGGARDEVATTGAAEARS